MERRRTSRYTRRLPVTLWIPGTDKGLAGYTTNVSAGGLYVHANRTLPRRTRVRVQIGEGSAGAIFEAVVVKENSVDPALRVVEQPGMGLRFLQARELLGHFVPSIVAEVAARPRPSAAATDGPAPAPDTPVVDLSSPEKFAQVWKRDLRAGGLFVTSTNATTLHKLIHVAVRVPNAPDPIVLAARVVLLGQGGFAVEFADRVGARTLFGGIAARIGVV